MPSTAEKGATTCLEEPGTTPLWDEEERIDFPGGPGGDDLYSRDGVSGNDRVEGGDGLDFCVIDSGDRTISCEIVSTTAATPSLHALRAGV